MCLPSTLRQNPWRNNDGQQWYSADVSENSPIRDIISHPRQNCAGDGEIYTKGDIDN